MVKFDVEILRTLVSVSSPDLDKRPKAFKPLRKDPGRKADLDLVLERCTREDIAPRTGSGGFRGYISKVAGKDVGLVFDPPNRKAVCFFEEGLSADMLLYKVLNMLLVDLQPVLDILFVHSACIVMGGKAYIFIAPSGGGKSTISSLAAGQGMHVIDDDFCVAKLSGDGFYVTSFPCLVPGEKVKEWELGGAFLLKKSDADRSTPLSGTRAMREAMAESVRFFREASCGLEREEYLKGVFRLLCVMADKVGFRKLDFTKDGKVFSCL